MSSAVQICKLALGHLGDSADITSIAPPDGSVQAAQCAVFYPLARDALLTMRDWTFATKRVELSLSADDPPDGWSFAYSLPSDCLRPQVLLNDGADRDEDAQPFVVEGQTIYTHVENAWLRYTFQVVDAVRFPPLFVVALSRLLASMLAGPLIRGKEGRDIAKDQYSLAVKVEIPEAAASDKNSQNNCRYGDFTPESIGARA